MRAVAGAWRSVRGVLTACMLRRGLCCRAGADDNHTTCAQIAGSGPRVIMGQGIAFFVTAGADGKIDSDEHADRAATTNCVRTAVAHHCGLLAFVVFHWTKDEADLARMYLED